MFVPVLPARSASGIPFESEILWRAPEARRVQRTVAIHHRHRDGGGMHPTPFFRWGNTLNTMPSGLIGEAA